MINEESIARDLFTFGGSAGSIEALVSILSRLPAGLQATLAIAIHRNPRFQSTLDEILGRRSALPVREPKDGEALEVGQVYLAPRDRDLTLEGETWRVSPAPHPRRLRPAVDPLFVSAAKSRGARVVGVLLSGGGADGVEGLIEIKKHGGLSIAQDPSEARQPSMPESAIRYDDVDLVLPTPAIAAIIPTLAAGRSIDGGDGLAALNEGWR